MCKHVEKFSWMDEGPCTVRKIKIHTANKKVCGTVNKAVIAK